MLCKECCGITLKLFDIFCKSCGKGVLNFGKYRNYTFMYVKIKDPKYCEWVSNMDENIPTCINDFLSFLKSNLKE